MRGILLSIFLIALSVPAGAQVTANFTASPTTGCSPMVVSFSNTSTGASSYSWNFGNSSTSTAASPTTSYTSPGTYTVTLTASNGSSSNTKSVTITVQQPPTVSTAAGTLQVCPGGTVGFSSTVTWNSTGGGTYLWDFGDGNTSTAATPSHSWVTGGTYHVVLTATNSAGCPTADTITMLVYGKPSASFTASDTAICTVGGATTFSAPGTGGTGPYSYYWDFGDGSTSTSSPPIAHNYSTAGSYSPKLIITDANGCKDSLKRLNYIRVLSMAASISAPLSLCAGASVPMMAGASTTSGSGLTWNFGDGSSTMNGTPVAHTYLSGGTYTITLTAINGGCTVSATQSIVINPKPSAIFSFSPTLPCPAQSTVSFSLNSPLSTASYSWQFGDGGTGSGATTTHTYGTNDTFDVILTATSAAGCTSSTMRQVELLPILNHIFTDSTGGCAPLYTSFRDTIMTRHPGGAPFPYPAAQTAWSWNFGDGGTSTARYPTHTYLNPGSYTATVAITTANGCTILDTVLMAAGTRPSAHFRATPTTACVNETIQFYDSSYTTGSIPINSWHWFFGNGGSAFGQSPIWSYGFAGVYTDTLIAAVNGCKDTAIRTNYITVNWPRAQMRMVVSCDTPGLVHFRDTSIGATSHIFYFGDGGSSTAATPSHVYAPGTYNPKIIAFNSTTGCTDSASTVVNLNPVNLTLTANDTAICMGDTVTFAAHASGGNVVSGWQWWIGTGSGTPTFGPPNDTGNIHAFPNRGQYSVAVRVGDLNGCMTTLRKNAYVTVGPPLISMRAAPNIGCGPITVIFKDSSVYTSSTYAVSRFWDFGDGTNLTTIAQSISHTYTNPGAYGILLKVKDNIGCTDSQYIANFVNVYKPVAVWSTAGTTACVGKPFNFFNSSTGASLTYFWSFGDGTSSTAANPSHAYAVTGTYTVRLTVTDIAGCRDSMVKTAYLTVQGPPTAAFSMSDTINVCPPMVVNFTNLSTGGTGYAWDLGNGASSTLANPTATYISPGVYSIRLITINAGGCRDTAFGRVRVLGYRGVLSYSPLSGCVPTTVTFRANNVQAVPGFIYDFDDGTTAATTATFITHTYTTPGPHVPRITLTDNLGCSAVSIGLDTIKIDAVVSGYTYTPYPACGKGTISFIDTSHALYSGIASTLWRFHNGTTSTSATPSLTYYSPGNYNITLYHTTNSGCKDTLNSTFHLWPIPVIEAGPDTTVCITDAAILRPSGGVSYLWAPAATLSCAACENPAASPTIATRYTVVGTDGHGCTNKDSMTVFVKTKVVADVTGAHEICAGDTIQLFATGGAVYAWSPPAGLSRADTSSPRASPATTTQYTLITRYASCIPDTDFVEIVVHPRPEVQASHDVTMIAGTPVDISAVGSSFITSWSWTPELGLSCAHCTDPEAAPTHTTTYTITGSTEWGCTAKDSVTVFVVCDGSQVYLPNTFTPDGNGVNDVFYPRGRGIATVNSFRVYNRWGETVFERHAIAVDDKAQGWDGKMTGQVMPPDVYVYVIEATCDTGEAMTFKGDVMLLR